MIPVSEFRSSLEKNAGKVGDVTVDAIFKGIGKLFRGAGSAVKYLGTHPKTTVGGIAGIYGAMKLSDIITEAAANAHPAHQMYREETKNKMMNDQNRILMELLEEAKKKPKNKQGPISRPLT